MNFYNNLAVNEHNFLGEDVAKFSRIIKWRLGQLSLARNLR